MAFRSSRTVFEAVGSLLVAAISMPHIDPVVRRIQSESRNVKALRAKNALPVRFAVPTVTLAIRLPVMLRSPAAGRRRYFPRVDLNCRIGWANGLWALKATTIFKAYRMADESELTIFIIIGRVWETEGGSPLPVHVMLTAPDEDSAVRKTLNSLADEGFIEAELDQIGLIDEEPEEEPHISAYQGALEGEVAIIRFTE
jgi:hypothetical protein